MILIEGKDFDNQTKAKVIQASLDRQAVVVCKKKQRRG